MHTLTKDEQFTGEPAVRLGGLHPNDTEDIAIVALQGLTTVKNVLRILHPNVIKRAFERIGKHVTVLMVSSWNIHCGIAEYTKTMVDHMPSWCHVEVIDYSKLERIGTSDADILHIQWEPGLCDDHTELLEWIRKWPRKLVATAHYYDDFMKAIRADLSIVHNENMVTRPNHHFLVQGCPVFPEKNKAQLRHKLKLPKDALIIASFGFIMPWKNLDEIVRILIQYIKLDPRIYLLLLHSPHPKVPDESARVIKNIDKSINNFGLNDRILRRWEFMEKEDINDYFQASDIGMLYAPTADSKGSSAVVKEYVAGRLGLIASHIRHYSDLKKGLLYVQSGDIHAIIYKTLSTLTDPIALSKLKHEQNENYKEINYTRVSLKHAHLYHEVLSQ